jgi:predicted transcriptional regulator
MGFEAKVLGRRISDARKQNNISQEKLAEILNKSVPLISLYESGKRIPPPDVLFQLAELFRVSSDYLLGLTDNPEPMGNIPKDYIPPDYEKLKAIEAALEKIDLKVLTEIDKLMKE